MGGPLSLALARWVLLGVVVRRLLATALAALRSRTLVPCQTKVIGASRIVAESPSRSAEAACPPTPTTPRLATRAQHQMNRQNSLAGRQAAARQACQRR